MRAYKSNFRFNASHDFRPDLAHVHAHTFELGLYIQKEREDFVEFDQIEENVNEYLIRYRDKCLNKVAPFDTLPPTIENICRTFFNDLSELLGQNGYFLTRLEMGETPCSIFSISTGLIVGSMFYDENDPVSRLISKWFNTHEGEELKCQNYIS